MRFYMNKFSLALNSLKNQRTALKRGTGAIALSILLLTLTTAKADAQESLQIGVKGGINLIKVSGRSFDTKTQPGANVGIYGELNFSKQWTLQPELVWNQIVTKTSDQFGQIYPGIGVTGGQAINNYLALPVLVSFKPTPELSIQLGPQYGYLVNQTQGLRRDDQNKGIFSHSDLAIVFGGQLNLGKVKIGARYYINISDVNGINNSDQWRQHGFQAYLAYQIKDIKLKHKRSSVGK
jgi:outer membrane immunogenic protein